MGSSPPCTVAVCVCVCFCVQLTLKCAFYYGRQVYFPSTYYTVPVRTPTHSRIPFLHRPGGLTRFSYLS